MEELFRGTLDPRQAKASQASLDALLQGVPFASLASQIIPFVCSASIAHEVRLAAALFLKNSSNKTWMMRTGKYPSDEAQRPALLSQLFNAVADLAKQGGFLVGHQLRDALIEVILCLVRVDFAERCRMPFLQMLAQMLAPSQKDPEQEQVYEAALVILQKFLHWRGHLVSNNGGLADASNGGALLGHALVKVLREVGQRLTASTAAQSSSPDFIIIKESLKVLHKSLTVTSFENSLLALFPETKVPLIEACFKGAALHDQKG